jgi:hypothetical protein
MSALDDFLKERFENKVRVNQREGIIIDVQKRKGYSSG